MKRIAPHHPHKMIPGIPAMCTASAELGIPLREQGKRLLITDHAENNDQALCENMVIMKVERNWTQLDKLSKTRQTLLARNVGLPDQQLATYDDDFDRNSCFITAILQLQQICDFEYVGASLKDYSANSYK